MNIVAAFFREVLENFFYPRPSFYQRWLTGLWLPGLYLIGLVQWGSFLNWGNIPLDFLDWGGIVMPRLLILKDALVRGVFPLHSLTRLASGGLDSVTDRYLGIPDILLSPQIFLLKNMQIGSFILVNFLMLYTIGFIGLLLARKKYSLSLAVFTVLFLLFNFNGHIVTHTSIGHTSWVGHFLFPFYILLVLELFERPQGWNWLLKFTGLMLFTFLQGAYHQFIWMLMFTGLSGIFDLRRLKICLAGVIFSVLASLVRILPVILGTTKLQLFYLGGFTTLNEFFRGFVTLVEPAKVTNYYSRISHYLAWWEVDFYLGWLGVLFIAGMLFLAWRTKLPQASLYRSLAAPVFVLTILSIGRLYRPVFLLNLPLFTGERVGTRFLILPLMVCLFLAAISAQRLLETNRLSISGLLVALSLIFILWSDLLQHTEVWSVIYLDTMTIGEPVNKALWAVANHPDPQYSNAIIAGGVISILTFVFLSIMSLKRTQGLGWLQR